MPRKPLHNDSEIRRLVEDEKLQQWKVAERLGMSRSGVTKACKRLGLRTQKTGPREGEGNPEWKGGRMLCGSGPRYWYCYRPDHPNAVRPNRSGKPRYVAEHRLVMEDLLGRFLTRKEVVHHRNGDTLDNRPENLQLFRSNGEHLRETLKGRCPDWSPEGKERIRKAVLLRWKKYHEEKASQTVSGTGARESTRPTCGSKDRDDTPDSSP